MKNRAVVGVRPTGATSANNCMSSALCIKWPPLKYRDTEEIKKLSLGVIVSKNSGGGSCTSSVGAATPVIKGG
jgi:hypothetical protein